MRPVLPEWNCSPIRRQAQQKRKLLHWTGCLQPHQIYPRTMMLPLPLTPAVCQFFLGIKKLRPEEVSGYLIYRFGDTLRFSQNRAACQ